MHPVRLPYLVDRLHPAQCFQTDLRLELGCVDLPLLRFAHYGVLLMTEHSLIYCLKTWVHYSLEQDTANGLPGRGNTGHLDHQMFQSFILDMPISRNIEINHK